MLFSRTRGPVLLMTLVMVVTALGIIVILRAVSASPNDKDHSNKGHSTLTLVTKNREIEVVDLGAQGPTQGDMRVTNALLYNDNGRKKVGRFDQFGVMTDPADEASEKVHMVERTFTYTLPGGEISAQGLAPYPKFDSPTPESVDAISGGTGKYAGVRGEVSLQTRGNKVIHTFHFID